MRILVKEHDSILSDLTFEPSIVYVGSRPDCGVHLPDMGVHHRHARLLPGADGAWVIEHLSGDAETWVNGRRLRDIHVLATGDQIGIKDYTLQVYLDLDGGFAAGSTPRSGVPDSHPLPDGALLRSRRESVTLLPDQADDLVRLVRQLAGCADLASVFEGLLSFMLDRFKVRTVWLGVRRRQRGRLELTQGRDYRGQVIDAPLHAASLIHRCVDSGQGVWVPRLTGAPASSLIAVPLAAPVGRLGVLYLDTRPDSAPFDERNFDHLLLVGRVVGVVVDAVVRDQLRVRQVVTEAERSIVQAIQSRLDPYVVPEWPELQVAVHCSPGSDRVGDVYDIARLPNGAAAFFVGHVSASAVAGAVAMIEARSAFRIAVLHSDMPHVMMQNINYLLCGRPKQVVMNAAIVLLDPRTGALLHALAGPLCGAVIGQSGEPRPLDHPQAAWLGVSPTSPYGTRKGILGLGESLTLFTGGVARIQDAAGQEWGLDRLLDSLCDSFGMSARTALNETLSDITTFMENGYQPEDVTLMLAHRAE